MRYSQYKTAFRGLLHCKVLQSFSLCILLPLGTIDANKQWFVQQREMVLQVNGALLAPGLWSSCSVSKAKDPLSCQQAGKQKTSSNVGSWIKSTDMVPDSQAWGIPRCSSLCCCRQVLWWLCLWTAQTTHPSCSLLQTSVYPQEMG